MRFTPYITLAGLALLGRTSRRVQMVAFLVLLQIVLIAYAFYKYRSGFVYSNGSSGPVLFASFFAGFVLFLYKDDIAWNKYLFSAALVLSLILEVMPFGNFLIAVPGAYVTVFLGRLNPARVFPITQGDYSYGIFLYGLPIQQSIAALGPSFQHWYVSLILGLPLTVLAAVLSWHFVERPALSQRGLVDRVEQAWLRRLPSIRARFNGGGAARSRKTQGDRTYS